MSIVYKYYPPERIDFFTNYSFRFTPPTDLNDKIECVPAFAIKDFPAYLDSIVQRNSSVVEARYGLTIEQISAIVESYKNTMSKDDCLKTAISVYKANLDRIIGVLSLTKNALNEVMWANYAFEHSGFLLGLDEDSDFFKKKPNDSLDVGFLEKVIYNDKKSVVDLSNFKLDKKIFYSKTLPWAYEEEYRIIRELKNADKILTVNQKEIYLFRFPKEDVREVIVGNNSSNQLIQDIQGFNSKDFSSKLRIRQARYNSNSGFELSDL